MHPHPKYADVVREAVEHVIEGTAMSTVALLWETMSVERKRAAAEPWDGKLVAQALDRAAIAGLYTDGTRGGWPALIDESQWKALQLVFSDNRTRFGKKRNSGPFTGLFRCECGRPLYKQQRYAEQRGKYRRPAGYSWVCLKRGTGRKRKGCGSCSVRGDSAEAWVRAEAMIRLRQQRVARTARARDRSNVVAQRQSELRKLERRLHELQQAHNAGDVSLRSFTPMAADLEAQIEAADAAVGRAVLDTLGRDLPDDVFERDLTDDAAWDVLTPEEQGRLLSVTFPYGVLVRKAGKAHGNSFDNSRLEVVASVERAA
jgi:hypothetical protein